MQKNKNRPGYKKAKVGWIPEGWEVSKLGSLLEERPRYGINAAAVEYSEDLPTYLRITDISEDGWFLKQEKVSVANKNSAAYMLEEGDLVFARTGASTGKTYLYDLEDGPLVFAGFLIRVRSSKGKLLPQFLKGFTLTHSYWNWISVTSTRSGQPGVNGNEYAEMELPLPPLLEQQAIVEVLECWDKGIRRLETKIERKRKIQKGLIQQLLSGKRRLAGGVNSELRIGNREWAADTPNRECEEMPGWNKVRLGKLGKFGKGSGITKKELVPNGVPCIRYGEIYTIHSFILKRFHSFINSTLAAKSVKIKTNDLLFAGSGETAEEIGKSVAYMNEAEAYAGGDVILLSVNPAESRADYLSYYLNTIGRRELNRLGQGQSIVHIYPKNLSKIKLTIPPVEEQRAIVEVLTAADEEIEVLEKKLALWKDQKKFLLNNLVTGTIQLPAFAGS